MKRREFLKNSVRAVFAAGVSGIAMPQISTQHEDQKRTRICISTWSFHNLFPQSRDEKTSPRTGKPLDVLEFPEMIADRYRVHNLEVVAPISLRPRPLTCAISRPGSSGRTSDWSIFP
jgi:hypothetical protein